VVDCIKLVTEREYPVMLLDQRRKEYNFDNFEKANEEWPQERWENEGKPHIWVTAEKRGEYEVQVNKAYGGIRLLLNDAIVAVGKYMAMYVNADNSVEVVALDKDYYGVSKFLWF